MFVPQARLAEGCGREELQKAQKGSQDALKSRSTQLRASSCVAASGSGVRKAGDSLMTARLCQTRPSP